MDSLPEKGFTPAPAGPRGLEGVRPGPGVPRGPHGHRAARAGAAIAPVGRAPWGAPRLPWPHALPGVKRSSRRPSSPAFPGLRGLARVSAPRMPPAGPACRQPPGRSVRPGNNRVLTPTAMSAGWHGAQRPMRPRRGQRQSGSPGRAADGVRVPPRPFLPLPAPRDWRKKPEELGKAGSSPETGAAAW